MGEFAQHLCSSRSPRLVPVLQVAETGSVAPRLDKFLTQEKSSSSSSILPTPVSPAWYDAEAKSWYGRCLSRLSQNVQEDV